MKDLITVIVNVYNGEKFINKCLDSVINQTYKNLEILIINDGSTDNTLSICKKYKDKRIKIITTENQGLSLSRNVGIDNAKGKYLYFVDVDDFIELDTIEYLYNLSKKYNTLISTCKSIDVYDYNFKIKKEIENVKILSSKEYLKEIVLYKNNFNSTWNKLYKKEIFNGLRFETRIVNDLALSYKMIIRAKKIVYSNQIKYYYLRHEDSITSRNKDDFKRNIDIYESSVQRYNYIKKYYSNFIENNLGVLITIMRRYLDSNGKMKDYLKEHGALKLYRKLFTFKIFKCDIDFNEKVKVTIFRISPKLYEIVIKIYLFMKNKIVR